VVADLATNIPEASECLRTDAQLFVAKQRSKGLDSFVISTIHRIQFTALPVTHLLTHSVIKFLSKTWWRFRREFSNFIRRCSRIFTSADIYENQCWIVTSGIRSAAEILCEYPKAEFISEKTPQVSKQFSRFTKLTHLITPKLMLLSKIYSDLHTNMCKPKDKYSRAILGSWSWFTGPSDGLKDYDNAGSFTESVVWCSIPRLS